MRTYRTSSVKSLYACAFLSPVEVSADEQNKQSIWSFLQASCSSLRLASGDLREQFLIEKESIGKAEVKVFIHRNSRYIALCYREAFRRWIPWLANSQVRHGQQTMESSWRKSAGRIFAGWKLHRTYRNQSSPKHQQRLQQATSSWCHFDQQFQGD